MQRIPHEFELNALKQVVEQSPIGIIITNKQGVIEYVNPAFSIITGYASKEILGQNPRIFKSGAHDSVFYRELWDTISSGKTWKGELLNKKKDGTLYWEATILSPVFDSNKNIKFYVGTKEDVSEKKFVNEELLRTEMQFKNLAETAPVIIAKIDSEGKLLYYNDYYRHRNNTRPDSVYDLLNAKVKGSLRNKIENVFRNSVSESFEIDLKVFSEQFETFIVKISPNIIGAFVESAIIVAQDITELLEARKIALKSEKNLLLLSENVVDVIWMLDGEKKISYVTPSVKALTGYSSSDFLQLKLEDYLFDESLQLFLSKIKHLSEILAPSLVEVWESKLKRKNGDIIWIENRTRVVLDEMGKFNGIIGITRDITERKNSEEILFQSEKKFRTFFENSNAIILVIDPEKEQVINVNRAATNYYGYELKEFQELDVKAELMGLIEASKIEASENLNDFKNVYAQRHKLKNNEYRDVEILPAKVEIEGKALVYIIVQDITKRKRAIEALRESESKKLALLKIIPDLIFVLNREGVFIDVYTDDPDRLIVPPVKMLGKKCQHIFPEGLCALLEKKIIKAFKTKEIQTFEYRYKRDLAKYVIEEIRVIVSGEDEVLAIVRDVTSQKKIEIELKRAWEEAKEANRLKDAFVANISHEIRTPINAILGFGELLQSELTNKDHIQYIESIQTSSKSLLNLINDLLDLSKIEAGKMPIRQEPVDLHALMSEIESIFSIKVIEKGLDFEINIHDNCPISIQSDEMRIRQILINLLSNAIKFTHDGYVRVNIKSFNSRAIDYIEYIDLKIEVEDTGIGISEDNIQQIFEAFKQQEQQDARKYGGTGLGLTITKKIVDLLNGTIQVTSELEKGSRFTVTIDNLEVTQSARLKLASSDTVYKIGHIIFEPAKILVADDVKTSRNFLKGIFRGSNMSFIEAEDGEEAIEQIIKHKPRLILINIKMPKKDGLEVAKFIKLQEDLKHISTIGVFASPVDYESDPRSVYFDEFVSKPIDIFELLMKLSFYLPIKEKQEEEKAPKFDNAAETKVTLKVIGFLQSELIPVFNEISKTSSFDDYNKFAKLLIDKGREFEINRLTYLGKAITDATKTFNLEKINFLFIEFKKLVADFLKKGDG